MAINYDNIDKNEKYAKDLRYRLSGSVVTESRRILAEENKGITAYDRLHKNEQLAEGVNLFQENPNMTDEELASFGAFTKISYYHQKRKQAGEKMAYEAGKEAYLSGKKIDEVSDIYKNNIHFLSGYKDAIEENDVNNNKNTNTTRR